MGLGRHLLRRASDRRVDSVSGVERPEPTDVRARAELASREYTLVPMLDASEVQRLRDTALKQQGSGELPLSFSYTMADRRIMAATMRELRAVLDPHVERTFPRSKLVFGTFVVKQPSRSSAMYLHDDRTYVDPRRYGSVSLWIPLEDVGPGRPNGGLEIVPRSSTLVSPFSGTDTPQWFRYYERHLYDRLLPVAVPAGTALVYPTTLLHASPPNSGTQPRCAIVGVLTPRAAQLVHVVGNGSQRSRLFRVDEEFFVRHHPSEIGPGMPRGYRPVGSVRHDGPPDPGSVARVLGLARAPDVEPLVPSDLAAEVVRVAPGAGHPCDRRPSARMYPSLRRLRSGEVRVVCGGSASLKVRTGTVYTSVSGSGRFRLVLDPGSRVELRTDPGKAWRVDVISAAPAAAGIVTDGAAMALLPGRQVTSRGEQMWVWNEGPGDADLVVAAGGQAVA